MFAFLIAALLQQPAPLPPAVADTSPFRRLELPAPSLTRGASGMPGPRYWQQRADYTIRVALDTATHLPTTRRTRCGTCGSTSNKTCSVLIAAARR